MHAHIFGHAHVYPFIYIWIHIRTCTCILAYVHAHDAACIIKHMPSYAKVCKSVGRECERAMKDSCMYTISMCAMLHVAQHRWEEILLGLELSGGDIRTNLHVFVSSGDVLLFWFIMAHG